MKFYDSEYCFKNMQEVNKIAFIYANMWPDV